MNNEFEIPQEQIKSGIIIPGKVCSDPNISPGAKVIYGWIFTNLLRENPAPTPYDVIENSTEAAHIITAILEELVKQKYIRIILGVKPDCYELLKHPHCNPSMYSVI